MVSDTAFCGPWCLVYNVVCCGHRLVKIKEWIDARDPNATIIPFSGALELKVVEPCLIVGRCGMCSYGICH